MKIFASLFALFIVFLLFSCKNERKKDKFVPEVPYYVTLLSNKKETAKLWKKALDSGDFRAYNQISIAYRLGGQIYELYYYSLVMANRYKCPDAYYHLFVIMNDEVSIDGLKLYSDDAITRNMALYYLLKSKELGNKQAQYEIDEVFGKGKTVRPSSYYLKKLTRELSK